MSGDARGFEAAASDGRGMVRAAIACLMAVSVVALTAGRAIASEPWAYRAYQPFLMQDGIAISPMTYTGYFSSEQVVEMTCWANRVWHQTEGRSFQENVAFMVGVRASLVDVMSSWPSHGDTIAVVLDLSRAHSVADTKLPGYLPRTASWPDQSLVLATIECMKANAAQFSEVHFLAVRILGSQEFAGLGGVFNLKGLRSGPSRSQF